MIQTLRKAFLALAALVVVALCAWVGDASTGTLPTAADRGAEIPAAQLPAGILQTARLLGR